MNWREFHYSPWNCLYSRSWVDFMESYSQKRFPRLSNSKILDYFKTAGISIWRGFNIFQKNETPDFWTIFKLREGVSSRNFPLFLEFQNSKLFQNRGNVKWREFHSSRSNGLYTRSWVDFKESNYTKTFPRLSNSKNLDYFGTAGMSNTGSFIPLLETPASQLAESVRGSFIQTPPTPSRFLEFQKSGLF